MYDSLKGELSEYRLKAAERAEKADYYRKTLEAERANREQVDNQVIDLLSNIRDKYNAKIKDYMAKGGKNKQNKNKQDDASDPNQAGDWGQEGKTEQHDGGWGTSDNQQESNGNANTDTWANNNTNDNGWGNTGSNWASNDASNNVDESWNSTTDQSHDKSNDDSWGNTQKSPKDNSDQPKKKDSPKKDQANNKKKEDNKKKDDNKNSNSDNKKNNSNKNEGTNKGDHAKESSKNDTNKEDQAKKNAADKSVNDKKVPNHDNSITVGDKNDSNSRELIETKSQLWTAKLDMRLLEQDKRKLTQEVESLKNERNDLLKKLTHVSEEQDKLTVKVRGLTVDLVGANEEIQKLNEKIDQSEADRRTKDRDVTSGESRRRAMESKIVAYQQQIANLQSDLKIAREEYDEQESRANDLKERNERLEADLVHTRNLVKTLKDGCQLVEEQVRTFENRHDTVAMSKVELERELIAIKEESSRHITTINKLQKSNEQISKAFVMSIEAHDQAKNEIEKMRKEFHRRLENCELENLRLVEANNQLRKLIDYLQKKVKE